MPPVDALVIPTTIPEGIKWNQLKTLLEPRGFVFIT